MNLNINQVNPSLQEWYAQRLSIPVLEARKIINLLRKEEKVFNELVAYYYDNISTVIPFDHYGYKKAS